LVAGYPDTCDVNVDIPLEYDKGSFTTGIGVLFDAARKVLQMFPKGTLFLEGDMIPNAPLDLVPSIRRYHTQLWPGIIYTGDADIDTDNRWTFESMADIFKGFEPLDYVRNKERFDSIGPNAEFLHPQGGCRGCRSTDKLNRFKAFVEGVQ
jgi:hypothetical protein